MRTRLTLLLLCALLLTGCAERGLPALESPDELERLTPRDFACMEERYPTETDGYTLSTGKEELAVSVLRGAEDGPVIYVVGGTHGDETAGWYAGVLLKKATLRAGTLYVISPVNADGAARGRRETKEGWDLNRHYPGDAEGVDADRIAAAVYADLMDKRPALVLDLHEARPESGKWDDLRNSIICAELEPVADLVLELLDASAKGEAPELSAPLTLYGSPPAGSLNAVVSSEGVPVLTVETDREAPLARRVQDQLRIAEYILAWYGMR